MWDITADEARKLSEVIFLVLPLLALADLVEHGSELGRSTRPDNPSETEAERANEIQALGMAVTFYCGFVASAALATIGLLIAAPPTLLAAQITVFFLTSWCLFAQIGNKFLIDLARIYRNSGGPELITAGRRLNLRDTGKLIAALTGRANYPPLPEGTDSKTAKSWRHRRRVALAGILAIPGLTAVFLVFVVALDIVLCTSARVIGT